MPNSISGNSSSAMLPIESLNSISEGPAGPQAGTGGEQQDFGADSSNPEAEIKNALNALAQDLQQLTTLLSNLEGQGQDDGGQDSGGIPSGNGNSGQGGGASDIPSGDSTTNSRRPQSRAVINSGSEPAGPTTAPASSSSGAAPSASTGGASGSASGGALGPNVPSALQPFVQEINAASKQTGVPASLLGAQILQESGGNPNAVTTNPALGLPDTGLMQVDQATFQGLQKQYPNLLGGKSVSDPATNIMAGALLDAQLLKQNNGNVGAALTAYNGSADSSYVNEVTSKMNALQNGTPVPGGFS
jgi:Transglycosylase SLT domain